MIDIYNCIDDLKIYIAPITLNFGDAKSATDMSYFLFVDNIYS